jgi:C_GCAxxG_C_C family probable redox protein
MNKRRRISRNDKEKMMKSIEERVAEIKDKHTRGYNCAQIVLCSYAEELGIDEETLFRISEGFGAGMGGMMQTCGAVTAMFMALGLANSSGDLQACDTKPQTMKKVRELAAEFEKKNGSIVCRELKGIDTGKVLRSCDGCIEDGIRILGEYLLDD